MKFKACLVLFLIALALPASAVANDVKGHEEMATDLRLQLFEIQAKEAELQVRLQQLDDAIKPENIERALAGIGSTKPEELREHRRRLLSIQRDGVRAQLKLLESNRTRLEAALAAAEAAVYQESAGPTAVVEKQSKRAASPANSIWFGLPPTVTVCKESTDKGNETDAGRVLKSTPAECSDGPSIP